MTVACRSFQRDEFADVALRVICSCSVRRPDNKFLSHALRADTRRRRNNRSPRPTRRVLDDSCCSGCNSLDPATQWSHRLSSFYLYTGRKSVAPPVEHDPSRTRRLLESVPVSYVIVDPGYNLSAIETGSEAWQLVKQFHGRKLYARNLDLD